MSSFNYYCTECGGPATKPPCAATPPNVDSAKKAQATLGTWRCNRCGKCKVKREKRSK